MSDNLCYQATCHSATCCQCVTHSFSIAFSTCKARKLHQYFIGGSILLCTDSMGKEINRGVLIMQCGDTDLILCLSTCTDILMHSAPLLSSTQEVFTLFVQSLEKKKTLPVWQRLHHCLNHLKTLMKMLGLRAGVFFVFFFFFETRWKYISSFFYRNNVNAKCRFDNWCWQLSRCLEGELWEALTGD